MFGLPHETEVYKFLAKSAIYRKFGFTAAQKASFDEDIKKISIIHEISDNTLHLSGSDENEFFILEIQLKHKDYDPKNIERLTKLIDRNLLLALTYEDQVRFAVFKTVLHQSEWQNAEDVKLTLNGYDYDTIWENTIRSVIGIAEKTGETLEKQITSNIEKAKIQKQIEVLKKKMKSEKQFNRQIEIKAEIKKLEGMLR